MGVWIGVFRVVWVYNVCIGGVWVYTRGVRVCGWGCLGVLGEVRV